MIRKYLLKLCVLLMLVSLSTCIRVFLMGGACTEPDLAVYKALAQSTSKTPQPSRCNSDWTTTTCPKILVITSAAQNEAEGNDAYSVDTPGQLSYQHLFIRIGMSPKHLNVHIDNYLTTTDLSRAAGIQNAKLIRQADIVFFNGGDQGRHARSWLKDNGAPNQLLSILASRATNNQLVISGSSAGNMIMSPIIYGYGTSFGVWYFANSVGLAPKTVIDGGVNGTSLTDTRNGTSGLQYQENAGKMPGFQFVPYLMDTHFDARGRLGRIVAGLIDLKQNVGIGVDEKTCLDYNNGVGKVIGKNGVFIVNTTFAQMGQKGPYLQYKNVTTHYLTEGDIFNFNTNTLRSSKDLIKTPYYSGPTDSSDILKSYQCAYLITRLVDQRAGYNIGKTTKPSGYPSSTPTLQMIFYKNSATKGYFANGKYTAENVLIDYDYIR